MPGETLLFNQAAADGRLSETIARAGKALLQRQHADGHWLFELEADATIPAEYVLLEHFLDRIDASLEAKIGVFNDLGRPPAPATTDRSTARSLGAPVTPIVLPSSCFGLLYFGCAITEARGLCSIAMIPTRCLPWASAIARS